MQQKSWSRATNMNRRNRTPLALFSLAVLAGCSSSVAGSHVPATAAASAVKGMTHAHKRDASTQLKHIVVIIQENRSVDNLFNGFCVPSGPCANTVPADPVSGTPLVAASMAAPYGLAHSHEQFIAQYDYGKMDGFPKTKPLCRGNDPSCGQKYTVFAYVPSTETALYRQLASVDAVLSDATFEPDQGPSFPSHIYAIAGQAGGFDSDHYAITGGSGTCGSPKMVSTVDMTSQFPGKDGPKQPSCKDFPTIFDSLANAGHSWRYYSNHAGGFFSPTDAIQHLYGSPYFVTPSTQFLTDVQNGNLADVSFISPWSGKVSDHPETDKDPEAGPKWVASLVNAIGTTPYWNNTAVVIFWDDWGGWFDHVAPTAPTNPDPYEYGFRVPLLVASPYARVGTIDHTPRSFVSALRLIEETFQLPSLGTLDQYEPDGLDSMMDYNQAPLPFTQLGGSQAQPFRYRAHADSQPVTPIDED